MTKREAAAKIVFALPGEVREAIAVFIENTEAGEGPWIEEFTNVTHEDPVRTALEDLAAEIRGAKTE
jgi:hypothetical protein